MKLLGQQRRVKRTELSGVYRYRAIVRLFETFSSLNSLSSICRGEASISAALSVEEQDRALRTASRQ